MGILSDEMEDIGNKAYGVNTVSTIRNCHDYSTVYCINFIDDSKRREGYYNAIKSLGGSFSSVCLFNSSVPSDISYEEAFYLGTNSIIGHSCRFGKFVKIGHNTIIGCNCIIGNYVTIGDNLVIPNGTIIKDYSTLQ